MIDIFYTSSHDSNIWQIIAALVLNHLIQFYVKVKSYLVHSSPSMKVSAVLYNLNPSKELTQPWCELSPCGVQIEWAAYWHFNFDRPYVIT